MANEVKNDLWYLDSSCSNYIIRDKYILVDLDESIKTKEKIGNEVIAQVQGLGTIGAQTKQGTKFICDVLFIPDFDQHLLSFG